MSKYVPEKKITSSSNHAHMQNIIHEFTREIEASDDKVISACFSRIQLDIVFNQNTVSLDISYAYQLSFPVLDNLFLILSLISAVLDNKAVTFFIMPGIYCSHAISYNIFLP
jgi:hypothetical protein